MTSEYEVFGVDSSNPPDHLEPRVSSPSAVLDQFIDRDLSVLSVLTLRCVECGRHGAAKDGDFVLYPGLRVYCRRCENAEAHG